MPEEKKDVAVVKKPEAELIEMLKEPMALGDIFAKSGMFKDVKSAAQGAVKILAGRELGLSPIESLNSLYFVNNTLALYAKLMASLVKKSPKYDYQVLKLDETECSIQFSQKIEKTGLDHEAGYKILGVSTFTFKDAAKAGLVNKEVWKSYPRNMLFARAISNGVRFYCPEVASGFMSAEEAIDMVPEKTTLTFSDEGVGNGEEKKV